MEPSVKGSLFVTGVVAIRRHRESGILSEDQLETRLGPEAIAMLDQKIEVARWYPVQAFCEMVDLDWDIVGGRSPEYIRKMGANTAARFFRTNIYQQLDYAKRVERPADRSSLLRQCRLVTSVTASLYNFLRTEVRVTDRFLQIDYLDAEPFSEALRFTTEGFMNEINRRQNSSRGWTSERVTPGLVRFQLDLPDRLSGDP